MTKASLPIYFKWTLMEFGVYKPLTLVPTNENDVVVIDVPLTKEYIYNAEVILTAHVSGTKAPHPVLTVAGLRYCLDYSNVTLVVDETGKPQNEADYELID
jgi:hypothetical protein